MTYQSTGRSTGPRSDLTVGTIRSTARSTENNREHCSQFRSTARSTGPLGCQTCTALCTSVDRTVDRPGLSVSCSGSDKQGKNNFKTSSKNSIKILLTFYIEIQTYDKKFQDKYQVYGIILCLASFIKNNTCILSNFDFSIHE